jgi:hypothetical protein
MGGSYHHRALVPYMPAWTFGHFGTVASVVVAKMQTPPSDKHYDTTFQYCLGRSIEQDNCLPVEEEAGAEGRTCEDCELSTTYE